MRLLDKICLAIVITAVLLATLAITAFGLFLIWYISPLGFVLTIILIAAIMYLTRDFPPPM